MTVSLETPMNIRRAQAQILREVLLSPRETLSRCDAFKIVQSLGQLLNTIEKTDIRKRMTVSRKHWRNSIPQINDVLKRWERLVLASERPKTTPKTDEEWIRLIREVDRAFNGGFCHHYQRPKYSDEDKEQIRALRSHVLKLVEERG